MRMKVIYLHPLPACPESYCAPTDCRKCSLFTKKSLFAQKRQFIHTNTSFTMHLPVIKLSSPSWSIVIALANKGPVTRCNFSCNLSCNAVARQVSRTIAPCNMLCNGQNRCETSCTNCCTKWNRVLFSATIATIFFSDTSCNTLSATCLAMSP